MSPRRGARFLPPQSGDAGHGVPRSPHQRRPAAHRGRHPDAHHRGAFRGEGRDPRSVATAGRIRWGIPAQAKEGGSGMKLGLSTRMSRVKASAIREILKVTERPDILSFAGGLPAPEAFPVAELARAHAEVFAREGAAALQYSTTEGFGPLRAWVAERMRRRGLSASPEQVLVTSGSQQGIDL